MDNRLTKDEGIAVHHVHHHGHGYTVGRCASMMKLSVSTVRRLLESAEKKSPGLFPILTPHQAKILHWYTVEGLSAAQIAMTGGVSAGAVRKVLRKLRDAGALKDESHAKILSFNEASMSDKVVARW